MNGETTTHDLIRTIESKDRRFRVALAAFMIVVALSLICILYAQFRLINEFRTQAHAQGELILDLQRDSRDANTRAAQQLSCIADFFANTDRVNRIITDLDDCRIEPIPQKQSSNDQTAGQTVFFPPRAQNPQPLTVQNSPAANPIQPAEPPPSGPSPSSPPPAAPAPDPPKPIEILGIPVCVPLTGVCVTR